MNSQLAGPLNVARTVIGVVRSDRITFIAAGLAYYAFISLLPLLLLAIVAASVLGSEAFIETLVAGASASFGEQAGRLVANALVNATGRGGATLVGTTVLVWSALKLFRGLDIAFSTVYGTVDDETLLDQLRDGLITLVGVGLAIGVTVLFGVVLGRIDETIAGIDIVNLIGTVVSIGGLFLVFLPLYYVLPDRGSVTVREAIPGALAAAIGWTVLQTGFRLYASNAASYQTYGVLGGVLLLVTFLYIGGIVLLLGVVLNAVLAGRVADETDLTDTDDPGGRGLSPGGPISFDVGDDDTDAEIRELRRELAEMEAEIDDRTVHREDIEQDLKQYVRQRVRAGKARGWGPYLVLLYGTAMTLGAFLELSGGWAVLAMLVIWLSTLGLYALMLIVGAGISAAGLPMKLRDQFSKLR